MNALWIRFVLFFIGPAIRREIARCTGDTVTRAASARSCGVVFHTTSLASEGGLWKVDLATGTIRLQAAVKDDAGAAGEFRAFGEELARFVDERIAKQRRPGGTLSPRRSSE